MLRFFTMMVFLTLPITAGFCVEDDPKTSANPKANTADEPQTNTPNDESVDKIAIDLNQNDSDDPMRRMQRLATQDQTAAWGHWGNQPDKYMTWDQHSNRLIPVYTFGITLDQLRAEGSCYADPER